MIPVGPEYHTGQAWFHRGLQLLREALDSSGVDPAALDTLDRALKELSPMAGLFPDLHRSQVRALALNRALRALGDTLSLLPEELMRQPGRPNLDGVPETLAALETDLGAYFRRMAATKIAGLYVIVDTDLLGPRDPLDLAEQVLLGGASVIQLRDKLHDKGDSLPLARRLVELCNQHDALCIINDHADLAVAAGAHGVHLGQHDLPVADARATLRPWQLAGASNALVDEAMASDNAGADYLAVGAMFPSGSKTNTRPAGPETLQRVRQAVPPGGPPLVAIGGITRENVAQVAQAGADAVCVIGAVTQAEDPRRAAEALLAAFRQARFK